MKEIIGTLCALFNRDLNRLINELESYSKEENLWIVDQQITNTAGNLALHLVGNLNTFIAGAIGKSGYIRKRDEEFSLKDVPRAELIQMINDTKEAVDKALSEMDPTLLNEEYPIAVFKDPLTYQFFLLHLSSHFTYHLGQINYHRRLLDQ